MSNTAIQPPTITPIPLNSLCANREAVVVEMECCPEQACRFAQLGIFPGAVVRLLCSGRTCMIRAGRTRLSVRSDEIRNILVEPLT